MLPKRLRIRNAVLAPLAIALTLSLMAAIINAQLDVPHYGINDIGCENCHFPHNTTEKFLNISQGEQQDIDDTPVNNLCWSCHNDVLAPYVRTHSALTTGSGYSGGNWSMECRQCHWPHQQPQLRTYGSESYLYSGASTSITSTTLTKTGAAWTAGQYKDSVLIPNIAEGNYNYKITGNTNDTLTIAGPMDLTKVAAGDTFAIVYGKLIKSTLLTPSSGSKPVKFFRTTGNNSFADGDPTYNGVCEVCHTQTDHHRNDNSGGDHTHNVGLRCTSCHGHVSGFKAMGGGAHPTHVTEEYGPKITCESGNTGCHGSNDPPVLRDGGNLTNTTVCNDCHSSNGVATAKKYWNNNPGSSAGVDGSWAANESYASFCGSCHDGTAGRADPTFSGSGDLAPNVTGDNSTYGFFVTGHGKESGNYSSLSWQATTSDGNPAANKTCSDCHELTSTHYNNSAKRLKAGYENDANNTVCQQCHDPGTAAVNGPQWYTTYSAFQNSAHYQKAGSFNTSKCTTCHDVHGAAGAYTAMARGKVNVSSPTDSSNLCYQCHKDPGSGGIENIAVTGTVYNNDIQEAFSEPYRHELGTSFTINGSTYSLQCTSCHNVHIVSGKYWDLDQLNVSPVTRFSNPTEVWGDEPGEKMDDFADSGTYPGYYQIPGAIPNNFNGSALVDFPTFCLDCHQYSINRGSGPNNWIPSSQNGQSHPNYATIAAKEWGDNPSQYGGGDPHGLKMAGRTSLLRLQCPQDEWKCSYMYGDIFPRVPRGGGTPPLMKGAYTQDARVAGWNYVLSCTDCHDPHGGDKYSLMRNSLNRDAWHDSDQLYLPSDPDTLGYVGSGTQGFCYQCHAVDTKEKRQWHNQDGYCSPCNGFGSFPNHLGIGAVPNGKCNGICHSRWYSKSVGGEWFINSRFHENRRRGSTDSSGPDGHIQFFGHETRGETQVLYWFNTLVTDMKFEGNFKNSAPWNLHGSWTSEAAGTGTFTTGYDGSTNSAIDIDDMGVQLGRETGDWGGNVNPVNIPHEMKYAGTWEAWIYPKEYPAMDPNETGCWTWDTPDRYIMTNENSRVNQMFMLRYVSDGFGDSYRAHLLVNVNYEENTNDSYGWRGAYSNVSIPLNQWTHVAATYNASLLDQDRDPSDSTKGRIRIYVNGRDVTWNQEPSGTYYQNSQPGDNEGEGQYGDDNNGGLYTCTDQDCDRRFVIGGATYWPNCRYFIGKIDDVKVWNVDRGKDYFATQIPPQIELVQSISGFDQLYVNFSMPVYANSGGTGDLQPSDFNFTDNDDSRTITGVTHTAGDDFAILNLSSSLDTIDDVDTDFLAAVSNSIYSASGTAAQTGTVLVTALSPIATILEVKGSVNSSFVSVLFSDWVYTDKGKSGALQPSDFALQDLDNGRTILSVNHTAGEATAILNLSSPLDDVNDTYIDQVRAAGNSIFNEYDNPTPITFNTITEADIPYILDVIGQVDYDKLIVRFSGTVFSDQGGSGALQPEDFNLTDDDGRTITAVNHTPGIEDYVHTWDEAILTLSSPLNESDFPEVVTLAANGVYDGLDNLVNETPVNLTRMSGAYITSVDGVAGSNTLKVSFLHWVFGSTGMTGDLEPTDFALTDTNGDNPRTITNVSHSAGDMYAFITMSMSLTYADLYTDTISVASVAVFDAQDRPIVPENVTITGPRGPRLIHGEVNSGTGRNRIYVKFSEGVWSGPERTGGLQISDFVLQDTDNGRTITEVQHTPGSDWAWLNVSSDWDTTDDLNVDTIAAAPNAIYNYMDKPVDTTPRVLFDYGNFKILDAEAVVGQSRIKVTFEAPAYSERFYGGLTSGEFVFTDENGDNPRSISSVQHNAGDKVAVLTMSAPTNAADLHSDYLKGGYSGSARFYNPAGEPNNRGRKVWIHEQIAPIITGVEGQVGSDKVLVSFSEGVYTDTDGSGALTTSDFILADYIPATYYLVANNSDCGTDFDSTTSLYVAKVGDANGGGLTTNQSTCTNRTRIMAAWNTPSFRDYASFISAPVSSDVKVWGSTAILTANLSNTATNYYLTAELREDDCTGTGSSTLIDSVTINSTGDGDVTDYDLTFNDTRATVRSGYCMMVNVGMVVMNATEFYPQHQGDELYNSSIVLITNISQGRTITAVDHAAGGDTAILTLSSALNSTGDIGIDTLAAASSGIYNDLDNPVDTAPVTLQGIEPVITSVEGSATSMALKVTFSHKVYANTGKTGALQPTDFTLTDVSGDNPRTINAVQHTAGDNYAWINMSARLIGADEETDTLAALIGSIYNELNQSVSTTPIAITAKNGPVIIRAEGTVGLDALLVAFSEGVYTNPGQSGKLRVSDFILTDNDNSRTITGVTHEAGTATAILTLSSVLDGSNDIFVDRIAAASDTVYNKMGIPVDTTPVTIEGYGCPVAGTRFDFNEAANSSTVADNTGLLNGTVGNSTHSMRGDGLYYGDETETLWHWVNVNNKRCMRNERTMTVETRVYMGDVSMNYVDETPQNDVDDDMDAGYLNQPEKPWVYNEGDGRNYQSSMLISRGNWDTYHINIFNANYAGDFTVDRKNKARVQVKFFTEPKAFCNGTYPFDPDTFAPASGYGQLSSNIDDYPIVSYHWYKIRVVINVDKASQVVDIFVDDQGTDGNNTNELWTGYKNVAQSPLESSGCRWAGYPDVNLRMWNDYPYIADDVGHTDPLQTEPLPADIKNNQMLKGKMDWIEWKPIPDYIGVDDPPA